MPISTLLINPINYQKKPLFYEIVTGGGIVLFSIYRFLNGKEWIAGPLLAPFIAILALEIYRNKKILFLHSRTAVFCLILLSFFIISLTGGLNSPLYPVLYIIIAAVIFAQTSFNAALFLGYAMALEIVLALSSPSPDNLLQGSIHLLFLVLFSSISHFILTPLLFISLEGNYGENVFFKFFFKKFDISYIRKIHKIIHEYNKKGDSTNFFKKFLRTVLQLCPAQRAALTVISPDQRRAKVLHYLPEGDRDKKESQPELYLATSKISQLFENFKSPSSKKVDFQSKAAELFPPPLKPGRELFISALPIKFRGELIGILFLFSRRKLSPFILEFLQEYLKLINAIVYGFYLEFKYSNFRALDTLTGLLNFSSSMQALNQSLERAKINSHRVSLLMIELDNLREINRSYGYKRGDEILQTLASCIDNETREDDFAGRIGGKRFLLVLYKKTANESLPTAEKIRESFLTATKRDYRDPAPKLSIGIVEYPLHTNSKKELFSLAEKTLYQAQIKGQNKILIASTTQNTPLPENFSFYSPPPSGWAWSSSPPLNEMISKIRTNLPESRR